MNYAVEVVLPTLKVLAIVLGLGAYIVWGVCNILTGNPYWKNLKHWTVGELLMAIILLPFTIFYYVKEILIDDLLSTPLNELFRKGQK